MTGTGSTLNALMCSQKALQLRCVHGCLHSPVTPATPAWWASEAATATRHKEAAHRSALAGSHTAPKTSTACRVSLPCAPACCSRLCISVGSSEPAWYTATSAGRTTKLSCWLGCHTTGVCKREGRKAALSHCGDNTCDSVLRGAEGVQAVHGRVARESGWANWELAGMEPAINSQRVLQIAQPRPYKR